MLKAGVFVMDNAICRQLDEAHIQNFDFDRESIEFIFLILTFF